MKRVISIIICVFLFPILSYSETNQIVIDNFDDGNWTTLYGNGEIGLTYDQQESAGNTIISRNIDSSDHTTGSGKSLKLVYTIDVYGGVYIVFTANTNLKPYIDGNKYKQLSFWLKSSAGISSWQMELKDNDGNKAVKNLGNIGTEWTKFTYDLIELGSQFGALKLDKLGTLVFINKSSGATGSLWIDDILFDSLGYKDSAGTPNAYNVNFSDFKINKDIQSIRIGIRLKEISSISIEFLDKNGVKVSEIPTGTFQYSINTEHTFEWDGKDYNNTRLKNGLYFIKIEINSLNNKSKVIKPMGVFR